MLDAVLIGLCAVGATVATACASYVETCEATEAAEEQALEARFGEDVTEAEIDYWEN